MIVFTGILLSQQQWCRNDIQNLIFMQARKHTHTHTHTHNHMFSQIQFFIDINFFISYPHFRITSSCITQNPIRQTACSILVWRSATLNQLVVNLTLTGPRSANIFAEYNQQYATFHNLFISVRHSTCFRRFCRPSSGAQNCTYSVRYLSDQYCYLLLESS